MLAAVDWASPYITSEPRLAEIMETTLIEAFLIDKEHQKIAEQAIYKIINSPLFAAFCGEMKEF